jgi:hypothetical protein
VTSLNPNGAANGTFQPFDPATSGRLQADGTLATATSGGGGGSAATTAGPFSATSTVQTLIDALNRAGATPGSPQAAAITKQYTDALGISGNPLPTPGFSVGQYDPTRNKIYLPGTDLKYDNGQWGNHPFGTADQTAQAAPPSATSPYADQIRQLLMGQISQLSQPLDVNDSTIQVPFDAANLAQQRQLEQGKTDLAEQLYASGDLNTAALREGNQQANERAATGLAGVRANLIANQLTQRANQLQQLYALAVASGDSESARQVQLELASIQAQLTREGYGVNLAEFGVNQNANGTSAFF